MGEIKVSVICTSYNHEQYIKQCLDGILMQKTEFEYEVIIHDDASTDGTAEIIRQYAEKYPNIIRAILQSENQYSKKKNIYIEYIYPLIRGKYFAICEGDDYWTDDLKLQRQFDAMERHPEVDICAHGAITISAQTGQEINKISPYSDERVIPVQEVIMGEGGYIYVATASLFLRSTLIHDLPEFCKSLYLDYTLQIHGSLRGGMVYLPNYMSAYRYLAVGSWTLRMNSDAEQRRIFNDRKTKMLHLLDEYTDGKYRETIMMRIKKNEFQRCIRECDRGEFFSAKYKDLRKAMPLKRRMKTYIKMWFPKMSGLKQRIKMKGKK